MGGRCAVAATALVWAGLLLAPGAWVTLGLVAASVPAAWLSLRSGRRFPTFALYLTLALAAGARGAASRATLERAQAAAGDDAVSEWIVARVVSHPWREAGEPLAVVELRSARHWPAGTRARVRLPAGCDAEWGDRLEALAILEVPPARRNPGGYDSRAAACADRIAVTGQVVFVRALERRASWQRATVARWRRAIERALDRHLSPATRELTVPLVLGDRSGMSPELGWDLRASGLMHLLALSGLHVVWLAAATRTLVAALGAGPSARGVSGALAALLYVGVAGPLPSLVRAAVNEGLLAVARASGRAIDPVQALAVGTLGLLCVAPGWATDLGFQLSCAAALGLVTIGPPLDRWCERARVMRLLLRSATPTVAAQVLALPLLLGRFHAIAWSGLFANLAAVPVCGLLLAAAWLGAAFESLLPGAGGTWFGACEALSSGLRAIAAFAARAPRAMLPSGADPTVAWLAALAAGALAWGLAESRTLDADSVPTSRPRVAARWLGGFGVVLALLLTLSAPALAPPAGRLWLVALDVGQGDAIALGTSQGWWLVDSGPRTPHFDAGQSVATPFLMWAGVRHLEALVLTHDHLDHTGGARAIARALSVRRRVAPAPLPENPGPSRALAADTCVRGDTLCLDPRIVVLWPPRGARLAGGPNPASLVLAVGEGEASVLLAADVDSTIEDSLALASRFAVLKVAHHGAASSSGARFLARLGARVALVSCGRRNRFGHPDAGALARLDAAGIEVHRTDREGAVWLEISSTEVRVIDWRRGAPRVSPRLTTPAHAPAL